MATWRSGYAAVCKTVYPGSIPGVASSKIKHLPPLPSPPRRLGTNRGPGERFYAAERRLRAMGMTVQTPAVQQVGE
jgi:hypothetical protein